MLTKRELIKLLQTLPDKFRAEVAIEKILLLEKIHNGLQQSEAGKVLNKEQVKKRLQKRIK